MSAGASLFPAVRSCDVCGCEAGNGPYYKKGQPVIVALNLTIYRRVPKSRQLKGCKKVRVCESCLVRAIASRGGNLTGEATSLASALFGRIAERYSAMTEAKTI
jgi:hypothetical protein